MGGRRKGRIIAFQALYSFDIAFREIDELFTFSWIDKERRGRLKEETLAFSRLLVKGTIENLPVIDEKIKEHLEHWDFSRLSRVDLAILRMSVFCLLYQPDIPATVTIDEAVDIAKEFGTDESYRFINGVLDSIHKH